MGLFWGPCPSSASRSRSWGQGWTRRGDDAPRLKFSNLREVHSVVIVPRHLLRHLLRGRRPRLRHGRPHARLTGRLFNHVVHGVLRRGPRKHDVGLRGRRGHHLRHQQPCEARKKSLAPSSAPAGGSERESASHTAPDLQYVRFQPPPETLSSRNRKAIPSRFLPTFSHESENARHSTSTDGGGRSGRETLDRMRAGVENPTRTSHPSLADV